MGTNYDVFTNYENVASVSLDFVFLFFALARGGLRIERFQICSLHPLLHILPIHCFSLCIIKMKVLPSAALALGPTPEWCT
jgi:hypothetical protein